MKNIMKYILVLAALFVSVVGIAQSDSTKTNEDVIIDMGGVKVVVKEKSETVTTNENGDTITTKSETYEITTSREEEKGENTEEHRDEIKRIIKKITKDEMEDEDDLGVCEVKKTKFIETSWNNFGLGFTNLLNTDGKLDTDAAYGTMNVNPGKSINFDWKIVTQAMNLYRGKVRLVYGIGIDYNNYRFKKNIDLVVDSEPLVVVTNPNNNYKKNKLVTQYLTVPVLVNFKFSPRNEKQDYVYISGGANVGYLIGSHQKQVWEDQGKKKNKIKDDYNIEQFRVGYEVQFGYKNVVLFGKYFPKSIFKTNQGPDLRSVSAGILIGKV